MPISLQYSDTAIIALWLSNYLGDRLEQDAKSIACSRMPVALPDHEFCNHGFDTTTMVVTTPFS